MRNLALLLILGAASCRSAREPADNVRVANVQRAAADTDDSAEDATTVCPKTLASARKGGATPNKYAAPTAEQADRLRDIVERLLRGGAGEVASARQSASTIGFEVVDAPEVLGAIVVRETANHGGGAYLLRLGSSSRLLVEAPHTFYDSGTFPIACELFQRAGARALFVNTVHRYKGAPPTRRGSIRPTSPTRRGSLFQAATVGFVKVVPKVTVVQLHGFGAAEGRGRAVISAGERKPGDALVARVQGSFQQILGDGILRYPEDSSELGATTNVQGAAVRDAGGRFLHVEMGSPSAARSSWTPRAEDACFSALAGRSFQGMTPDEPRNRASVPFLPILGAAALFMGCKRHNPLYVGDGVSGAHALRRDDRDRRRKMKTPLPSAVVSIEGIECPGFRGNGARGRPSRSRHGPGDRPGLLDLTAPHRPLDADQTVTLRMLSAQNRIVIHSAGDVMLGRRFEVPYAGPGLVDPRDPGDGARRVVSHVAPAFAAADLRTVNLETVMSDRPDAAKYPGKHLILRSRTGSIAGVKALANVAILANNHARDFLDDGVADTRTTLAARRADLPRRRISTRSLPRRRTSPP